MYWFTNADLAIKIADKCTCVFKNADVDRTDVGKIDNYIFCIVHTIIAYCFSV